MTQDQPKPGNETPSEPLIPFSRLAGFIRQLSHDVRNGLNAIDLEATLIAELAEDPEIAGEARKLRGMVANVTKSLQSLSARFAEVKLNNLIVFPAREFLEGFRDRVAKEFPENAAGITWQVDLDDEGIEMDFELLITALSEILRNTFQHRAGDAPVELRAHREDDQIVFETRAESSSSPSTPPESWGREPFVSTRRGGYGLGLFHARRIVAAHGGTLDAARDGSDNGGGVVTRIRLPLKT